MAKDNLVGAAVGVVSTLANVLPKVKVLQKAQKGLKKLGKFIASIYVTAGDFFYRRNQIDMWFKNRGYGGRDAVNWSDDKIRDGLVDGKKIKGNYDAEFQRLQNWAVKVMNKANPGLGDLWKKFFPFIDMTSPEQSEKEPWNAMKVLIDAFKPGTFDASKLSDEELKLIEDAFRGGDNKTAAQIIENEQIATDNKMASFLPTDSTTIIIIVIAIIAFYFLFRKSS